MPCDCEHHDVRLLLAQLGTGVSGNNDLRLFIRVPWSGLQWTPVEVKTEEEVSTNSLDSSELTRENIDSLRTLRLAEMPLPNGHNADDIDAGVRFSEINDLCDTLSQELPLDPAERNPVGTIPTDQSTFSLYIAGVKPEGRRETFRKFQNALKPRNSAQASRFRGLSKAQRLQLARDFALRLFDLESTAWEEPEVWRLSDNKDIFVHFPQGPLNPDAMEFYITRRFDWDRDLTDLLDDSPSDWYWRVLNPTMWKLALLLIELCLNKTMKQLIPPGNEFQEAHRLMNTRDIHEKFGPAYKKAVRFCLFAATGRNINVSPEEFKTNVIDKINQARKFYSDEE